MTTQPPAGAAVLRAGLTDAIRSAVFEELALRGYGRLSIEAVAKRAGVGKTTVYRRWPTKLEMVVDTVTSVADLRPAAPDTGSLRGDLRALLGLMAAALNHPLARLIVPDLLAEAARNDEIAATLRRTLLGTQHEIAATVVERAVQRGELDARTDPDRALDLIIGPLYWRLAVVRTATPKNYLDRLAGEVAAALGAG